MQKLQQQVLIDTKQAAIRVGLSTSFLEKLRFYRDPGGPPFVKIGRCVRYRIADLDKWIDSRVLNGGES